MTPSTEKLTSRDQYKLACRLVRLHVAEELNPTGSLNVFRSFGVSAPVYNAACESTMERWVTFNGWTDRQRLWDFEDGRISLEEVS